MSTVNETIINVQEIEPAMRHQTIFDTFDKLGEGGSFVIHNNHDPLPVYYQMRDLFGPVFDWEYLQRGPEWWDVRVTRFEEKEPPYSEDDLVIDVPSIEPRLKHETIFKTYEGLKPGESLVIHNNHDPMPVYYQLAEMHGPNFTWEYLQQGPQWWDIRVTKNPEEETETSSATEMEDDDVLVINVPEIEPQFKHATIFQVFDNSEPGEKFIIHNDHDPKPVYYQLQSQRGDIFTWEYLQEGPEWWDILVTKKAVGDHAPDKPEISQSTVEAMKPGEIVIDVPAIQPHSKKHDKILATFDELKPGESFIIHNDHDPKPLFYQLRALHGDIFDWEYLEDGPKWWDIRVTMRIEEENLETIGEIVTKDISKAEVFKKYGIDFCCGGHKTVRQVCAEMGIDPAPVEKELHQPEEIIAGGPSLNYNEWNLDFLADYIVNNHHGYVRKYLPELVKYATKVAQVHGGRHPELHRIKELVDHVDVEMTDHMVDEEGRLFPIVKEILVAKNTGGAYERKGEDTFEYIMKEHLQEHEEVGDAMREIRSLSSDYSLPADACASYTLLFKMLEEFESDLFTHIHLENNILFLKAVEMEKTFV